MLVSQPSTSIIESSIRLTNSQVLVEAHIGPIPLTILSGLDSHIEQHHCNGPHLYHGIGFHHHDVLNNVKGNTNSMNPANICAAHCIPNSFEGDEVSQILCAGIIMSQNKFLPEV